MDTFAAVADPNRRKIVELLAQHGQLTATQIAGQFSVSAQAISQHLKILREAEVILMEKCAQQRIYRINPASLQAIESWARQIAHVWNKRYDAIAALLEEEDQRNQSKGESTS
jgi:DNA-binding transcriptional ArsR family regulator